MIELFKRKEDCFGCSACSNICPEHAITMKTDTQGFFYPIINIKKCAECGLCLRACQIDKPNSGLYEKKEYCYGIKNSDDVRNSSSSGGVYTAISDVILGVHGVCVGAAFDESMQVRHIHAATTEERDMFRGSKYVQSEIGNEYNLIADDLINKKHVLFSGTPCQVNGLKTFLSAKNVNRNRLVTIDIVCHGVPSPKLWREYVAFLNKKYHDTLVKFSFRDKTAGWRGYHIYAEFKNGTSVHDNHITQSYTNLFLKDVMLRPSCYYCPYASRCRSGDITIGDFWGIENIDDVFSDNKGISMTFTNTLKGERLLKKAIRSSKLLVKQYDANLLTQPNLYQPTNFGKKYDDFWRCFENKGFVKVAKEMGGYGLFRKLRYYRNAIIYRLQK